jgi:hypothetical protein
MQDCLTGSGIAVLGLPYQDTQSAHKQPVHHGEACHVVLQPEPPLSVRRAELFRDVGKLV